jgi:hypothetical protein
MCEILGLPPSYVLKVFPDITLADVAFLKNFGYYKIAKQLEYLGRAMKGSKK